jgi:heme-degrading monooxygenase HmoA
MYVAMNQFRVAPGRDQDFEQLWTSRNSRLESVPGFIAFHLLRGAPADDHHAYVSMSLWRDQNAFEDWTRSDAFRAAHAGAGAHRDLYLGPPRFEGFVAIQSIGVG